MSKPVISYLLSLLSLGFGEYFDLPKLQCIGFGMSIIAAIILIVVLIAYMVDCWKTPSKNKES